MYEKIITHNDFDGVVSAAICAYALDIDHIEFTGPRAVSDARISITRNDVVCDLPFPLECGLWFDHHEGNLEELTFRKIDPNTIPGRFAVRPSAARVVFEFYSEKIPMLDHFAEMVAEADIIDSFDYKDVADWRRETPAKIIDAAIKLQSESLGAKRQFLRSLVELLIDRPLTEVARLPSIQQRYRQYLQEEQETIDQIQKDARFLAEDKAQQVIIIDLTHHNRRPQIMKHLAFVLFPQAQAVIEIKNMFIKDVKTTNLNLGMSLSPIMNAIDHKKDIGLIMRELNIGSGHAGAGAGTVNCDSKAEMLKEKDSLLKEILAMYQAQ